MWLRLALAGCRSVWVPQPVSLYRFHPAQMTRIGKQMTTATFAVLDKLFKRSDLPDEWNSSRDMAYSQAHLRAAAQAFVQHSSKQTAALAEQYDPERRTRAVVVHHHEPGNPDR